MSRKPPFIEMHPLAFANAQEHGFTRAICMYVVDGDTADFFLDLGWFQYTYEAIRFAGINTPELRGTSGTELAVAKKAKSRVHELLFEKSVLLRSRKDRRTFDRFVADVYFPVDHSSPTPATVEIEGVGWASISDVLLAENLASVTG